MMKLNEAKLYLAKEANRVAVTAQWLWDNELEPTGYIFSKSNYVLGLDPWIEIQGVDAKVDGSKIILETGRTREKAVHPRYEVFVHRNAINRLQAKERG